MKKSIYLIFLLGQPLHAGVLFLNSTPSGADVSVIENKNKARKIGRTPIRFADAQNLKLVISKSGYAPQTNSYTVNKPYIAEEIILPPLSFTVTFPVDSGVVQVNGKNYTSLDGNLSLPYGNYDARYDKKKALFIMEAKSPYTPYVAVFATTLIASLGMVMGGAIAGPIYRNRFNTTTDFDTAANALTMSAAMNNLMWTGVGIGTGSLIGLGVFSYYEARERKRIKRFQARNSDYTLSIDLTDFNKILLSPPSEALLDDFIRRYSAENSRYLPQVYLRRAQLYADAGRNNNALRDLNRLIADYPAFDTYASAQKLRGSLLSGQRNYQGAYEAYKEASLVDYPDSQKKALEALSLAAQQNQALVPLLNQEIDAARRDRRFTDKNFLNGLLG